MKKLSLILCLVITGALALSSCAPQGGAAQDDIPAPEQNVTAEENGVTEAGEGELSVPEVVDDGITAWDFVQNMSSGWNLGNTLDAAAGTDNSPLGQETAWGNPQTSFEMIKLLKDSGFDSLRIPVTWEKQTGPAPEYKINPAFLTRVKEVVDYGIDNGLVVIINMHHEDWHFPSNKVYPEASDRLRKMWTQIAEYFIEYNSSLIFEALNEPRKKGTNVEWTGGDEEGQNVVNRFNGIFIETVRKTGGHNASRKLMIPTYAANGDDNALKNFKVPNDKNIIVSIHAYTPYNFALSNSMESNEFSPGDSGGTKDIDALFARLDESFIQKGIPVIIGETGARAKNGNTQARTAWAKYYSDKGREYGIPCFWWDNGAFAGNGELFGLMNRREAKWEYPEIADAFVGK